jgi:hypothetical protein
MRPRNPQLLFIRKAKYLSETQIDITRIEIEPRYDRQFDIRLSPFGPGTSRERYRTGTARTLGKDYGKHVKLFTDGSKMGDKVGYVIAKKEEHTINKRILPQNTVFSAEKSAIIGAIQSERNNRHEIVIITTKNPKEQTIRKMLDHERPKITHLWLTSHKRIPGNEKTEQTAKKAPNKDISTTE